jgi:hypothetical protein
MSDGRLRNTLEDLRQDVARTVGAMPTHQQFLQSYCTAQRS